MKKLTKTLALLMAACLLLAGCGGNGAGTATTAATDNTTQAASTQTTAPQATTQAGGNETPAKDTLVVVVPTDVGKFSPHYTMTHADIFLGYQVYDHLVHFVDGQWKGQLAESWTFSADKKTVTFNLRENATFHSGDPITAQDVKYSFDANLERPGQLTNRAKIPNIIAQNDHTLVMELAYPMESVLFMLATPAWGIMNQDYCEANGEDAFINPDGSGAYKLKSWNKGSSIELEAYEDYAGDKANIKYLTFEIIPDQSTAIIALEKGTVDLIVNASAANVLMLENNSDIEITFGPSHTSSKLFMNVRGGQTANQLLRQAIGHAIDREAINIVAYEERGEISTGIFSDFMFYSGIDFSYAYDLEKAKALMAEAGLDGITLTIKTSEYYGSQVPTLLQQDLAKIGIDLKIESLEMSAHSADYLAGNYELWYTANSSVHPDVSEAMYVSYHTPENSDKFFAPADNFINDLLDAAKDEPDAAKKTALYDEILMHIKDNAGQLDLVNAESNLVYRKGLKNVYLDPNGMIYCYQYFSW